MKLHKKESLKELLKLGIPTLSAVADGKRNNVLLCLN